MILVNCGDGKGKTTAAMGLALRGVAAGWNVVIVQFLKGRKTGEIEVLETLPSVTILRGKNSTKFSFDMNEEERAAVTQAHNENFVAGVKLVEQGACDLLIFDELLGALQTGLIDEQAVQDFLEDYPEGLDIVVTGREMPPFVEKVADCITEMKMICHPYEKGVKARRGIEF